MCIAEVMSTELHCTVFLIALTSTDFCEQIESKIKACISIGQQLDNWDRTTDDAWLRYGAQMLLMLLMTLP